MDGAHAMTREQSSEGAWQIAVQEYTHVDSLRSGRNQRLLHEFQDGDSMIA